MTFGIRRGYFLSFMLMLFQLFYLSSLVIVSYFRETPSCQRLPLPYLRLRTLVVPFQGKTTLNNALQIDLRRLNTRLNYEVERIHAPYASRSDLWRCRLELPYPQQVMVCGEGSNKKDAEKRCSAAACLKLLVR